jgi:Asp-tRNA(Asn)/Glu-tRNA(Gln) amidotransferase B subunit
LIYDLIELIDIGKISSEIFRDVLIGIINEGKPDDIIKHFNVIIL